MFIVVVSIIGGNNKRNRRKPLKNLRFTIAIHCPTFSVCWFLILGISYLCFPLFLYFLIFIPCCQKYIFKFFTHNKTIQSIIINTYTFNIEWQVLRHWQDQVSYCGNSMCTYVIPDSIVFYAKDMNSAI